MAGTLLLLVYSFTVLESPGAEIPDEVNQILEASCYDCHSTGSNSKDAVKALDFKAWDDYRLTKQIGLLENICKTVEENKMPPGKYLEFKPDRKLSDEQKAVICDWTSEASKKLMEGN